VVPGLESLPLRQPKVLKTRKTTKEITVLLVSAASIGFLHTLFGPDHYLPFIAMAKARKWSVLKTTMIILMSGIGHVSSSVVLGLLGVAFGIAVNKLEIFESVRSSVAAWMLIAFGLIYFVWGIRKAVRGYTHKHLLLRYTRWKNMLMLLQAE